MYKDGKRLENCKFSKQLLYLRVLNSSVITVDDVRHIFLLLALLAYSHLLYINSLAVDLTQIQGAKLPKTL